MAAPRSPHPEIADAIVAVFLGAEIERAARPAPPSPPQPPDPDPDDQTDAGADEAA